MIPKTESMWILLTLLSIFVLKCSCSYTNGDVKIVTYGEPCVETRQLPIKIEGPKPPEETQQIPVSLNFKVISDMYVQPRRTEYPIEIEVSCTTPSPSETTTKDTLRGKTYTYNTYIPPASNAQSSMKNYNYAVEGPVSMKHNFEQYQERRVQRLKGLTSRIDRILVPACEVSTSSSSSSSSSRCQCVEI